MWKHAKYDKITVRFELHYQKFIKNVGWTRWVNKKDWFVDITTNAKILLASLLFKYLISDFKSDEIQRDYQKSLGKVNFYELLLGGSKHI